MAEAESEKATVSPTEKTAAAKATKAGAAKKAAPESKPLADNGDGTITDPNTDLVWKKKDAWLDTEKFYTWQDHQEYVDRVNKEKFAGYDNWRIPTKAEAGTLVDKTGTKQCEDKNGTMFPLDPIFDAGCVPTTWISECSDEQTIRYDLKNGVDTVYPGKDIFASMRLVSKPGEAAATIGEAPATQPEAAAEKVETEEATKPAPAVAQSASGKSVPRPVKRKLSDEDKAVLKARAKAWAAEKKK